ncbi:SusE domain-containing protein [Dysgonomonas macrotermitis]|uniref:SusE outer membrane protein n=1 Tax=Dysgonomonas macrotermitis TaxID=1346286 RepID=A0A1M4SFG4_9BACT|nr:SusE domain-containing protein [Dysgonomonas macrotermitis]SHE30925.1 SusE outer membrane protein [Dysgonomonas macrotermitis]
MKTSKIYIIAILSLLGFIACSDDNDTSPALTKIIPSTIDNFPAGEYILSEPETGNPVIFTVTWTETMFHLDGSANPVPAAPVSYTLQIDKAGNNFASPQVLSATSSLSTNIYVADLNSLLIDGLGLTPNVSSDVELRLIANYGQNLAGESISANTIPLAITPYAPTGDLKPVYLIGDMNGWDNRNTDFIMFRNDSDPKNRIYTYTGRIQAGCYFKFIPEESLGSYKAYTRKDDTTLEYIESDGGAFYNETEGYKTITINLSDMTYTIEDYDMSEATQWTMINFVGAFCNWGDGNTDPAMTPTTYDPHIWKISLNLSTVEYGVKFRANHSWDNRWCPPNPDAVPYGITEFNPAGHDNNISLAEPGDYSVVFNDLTGHYVITKK